MIDHGVFQVMNSTPSLNDLKKQFESYSARYGKTQGLYRSSEENLKRFKSAITKPGKKQSSTPELKDLHRLASDSIKSYYLSRASLQDGRVSLIGSAGPFIESNRKKIGRKRTSFMPGLKKSLANKIDLVESMQKELEQKTNNFGGLNVPDISTTRLFRELSQPAVNNLCKFLDFTLKRSITRFINQDSKVETRYLNEEERQNLFPFVAHRCLLMLSKLISIDEGRSILNNYQANLVLIECIDLVLLYYHDYHEHEKPFIFKLENKFKCSKEDFMNLQMKILKNIDYSFSFKEEDLEIAKMRFDLSDDME